MKIITGVFVCIVTTFLPSLVLAETASEFLRSMEGNYSGRGNAVLIGDDTAKIACKIQNSYDAAAFKLVVTGECASTKGKGKVNGGIIALNNAVQGTFVAPRKGMEITQSFGSFKDGKMQLSTSMVDSEAGKLVKVRQVISRTDGGFEAEFFTFDNGTKAYEPSGMIKLKKL